MSTHIRKGTRTRAVLEAIANGNETTREIAFATDGTAQQTRSAIAHLVSMGLVASYADPMSKACRTYAATIEGLARINERDEPPPRPVPRGFKGEIVRAVMAHGYTSPTEVGRLAGCSARYAAMVREHVKGEKREILRRLDDHEIAGQGVVLLDAVCETMADIYVCRILASEGRVVIVDQHIATSPEHFSAAARRAHFDVA